jgi:two-component system LytT family sensor kinase
MADRQQDLPREQAADAFGMTPVPRRHSADADAAALGREWSWLSFWPLQLAGWAAYFVMVVATFLPMLPPGADVWPLVRVKIVRTAIGFGLTSLLRSAYRRVAPGRLGVAAAVAIPSAIVLGALWRLLAGAIAAWNDQLTHVPVDWSRAPREALDYALTILAWSAFYFGVKWARDLDAARASALEARALAQQAQLDALRYQLNPHFLFNALNSIRALVDDDRLRAKEMITALAEFLRYPLLGERRHEVSLGEELAAVRHYLAIEAIRFEGRLRVVFDVQDGLDALPVPGLLLHPLVENAVKHGMMTPGPLEVGVSVHREATSLVLRVINSGRWRGDGAASTGSGSNGAGTGTGLRNVRARLASWSPAAGSVTVDRLDGRVAVTVRLPLAADARSVDSSTPPSTPRRSAADVSAARPAGR